jgi:1-phosphatidylinositol phosphodiesterase
VPEKSARLTAFLEPTLQPSNPQPLTVVFNTASTFPLATPQWVSRGVGATSIGLGLEGTNARLTNWVLRQAQKGLRPRSVIMLDYYQDNGGASGIAPLLVAVNFI